ncbi:MAG TPA: FadD3 family acyl-CoA ligase [Jatrophihabitantaceae bacterium]|jgi:acyl-CoA synthetase (AMP-forming)/AMP-acid ligase II
MSTAPLPRVSPQTLPQLVRSGVARFGEREAVVDGLNRVTYEDLGEQVTTTARGLLAAGLRPGDRVAIWAPNSLRWVVSAMALYSVGAIVVPVNTRFKGPEARYVLEKSGARMLLVENGFLGNDYLAMLAAAGPRPPDLETVIRLDDPSDGGFSDGISWRALLDRAEQVTPEAAAAVGDDVAPDDVSDIIFTSGTTGHPKGVQLTHGQSVRVYESWSDIAGLQEGDRYLVTLPFFHGGGNKAGMIASLLRGATIVPMATFDARDAMALIEAERVSVMNGPPTIYNSILDHPDREKFDLSSLRMAATGAAVVPMAMVLRVHAELPFKTFVTAYGLTECCGTATMCRPSDGPATVAETNGRPLPGVELRIVDRAGAPVPDGDAGEVVIRGYNVTRGYFDDESATARAIDDDGWLHTGDVGSLDDGGNLRITDRLGDMIIVGGFNVYPAEVEQALAHHEAVSEVAVVGVPDDRLGEVGRAYVIRRPGVVVAEDDIIAWCRERLANFKVPRSVVFVDDLPRNATGKVLKRRLRDGQPG